MDRWIPSSKRRPCPICGRSKDGDCRIRADFEMIFCHRGQSFSPPADLPVGAVITDSEGSRWAYTGDSRDDRGGAVFVKHREAIAPSLPVCNPLPPVPRAETTRNQRRCLAATYFFRHDLRVVRYDYPEDDSKEFFPQFYSGDRWHSGAGSEVWPFYGSVDASEGSVAIEVEGEKCVDILRSAGIAAITHPGHQRNRDACSARYAGLAAANVKTVFYISDNDSPGRKKASSCAEAAKEAGVELLIIPAETIFDVPPGGSVDDMPPDNLFNLISVAIKSSSGARPAPLDRTSHARIKADLLGLVDRVSAGFSAADLQAAIADVASSHSASPFEVRRIWDSIQEDGRAEAEALSAKNAILQRQELEGRRNNIKLSDYLPEGICDSVKLLTANLSCDALTSVSVILAAASGAFKSGHRLDAGDGLFIKEPVIWLLVSGPSGSGKSPIMRSLVKYRYRFIVEHLNSLTDIAASEYERQFGGLPKNMRPEPPVPFCTLLEDFTTESLAAILASNHGRGLGTLIYSEEIKSIIGNFDEYKASGKGRGKETFLCLFDGSVAASHRIGRRGKMVAGKVQNAIIGGVQPGVFRRMVEEGDDAGLFARFLVLPIAAEYVEPNFFRSPAELIGVNLAEKRLEEFFLRCLGLEPTALRLEPEAISLFLTLHRDTYDKSQVLALESQRAILGKRLGYILQVALVMHLCQIAGGEIAREELYVSRGTLARAALLVDLLQNYAILEQEESQMQRHGSFDLLRRIHSFAKAESGCTPAKFLSASIPVRMRGKVTVAQVSAAMEQLVQVRLGEWTVKQGGRKTKIFVALGRYPD